MFQKLVCFAVVCVGGASQLFGANVALREHSAHQGSLIRLGDVADISAATTGELNNLSTTVLMPAPAPGTQQFLHRAQIRDLIAAQGIEINQVFLSGANVVTIGHAADGTAGQGSKQYSRAEMQEIRLSLQTAILDYLMQQTGHNTWKVEAVTNDVQILQVAEFGSTLEVTGGSNPWTGRQEFQLTGANGNTEVSLSAKVTRIQPVVVVVRPLERGEMVRATDVELRQQEGNSHRLAITSLATAVGMEARRALQSGTILQEGHLSAPLLVERGETVTVFARTAGITVRTFAIAKQNGAQGELVQVETLDGDEKFKARVSGRRQLEVLATGATAGDYASLPRHRVKHR